jgi:hypothetical protein
VAKDLVKVETTREELVGAWRAAAQKTVEGILEQGRILIRAKKALKHGQFEDAIVKDFQISTQTAQKLMRIAKDARFTEAVHMRLLPAAWSTLDVLTSLTDGEFNAALENGDIHPGMTKGDAQQIAPAKTDKPTGKPKTKRKREPRPGSSPPASKSTGSAGATVRAAPERSEEDAADEVLARWQSCLENLISAHMALEESGAPEPLPLEPTPDRFKALSSIALILFNYAREERQAREKETAH